MFLASAGALFLLWHLMDPSLLSEIPGLADKLKATSNKSRRLLVDALGRYPTLADDATETFVQGRSMMWSTKSILDAEYGIQTY
jgi:hypothetical protein